jgi:hypothetical protein
MTKAHTLILLAAVSLSIQACDQHPTSTIANPTSNPVAGSSPKAADLQSETLDAAEKEWSKVWIQHGDTWIAKSQNGHYLLQIKGRRIDTRPQPLSDADRLNNVQWMGSVAFHCSAARRFGFASNQGGLAAFGPAGSEYKAGWNEWYVPDGAMAVYRFKKQNKNWRLLENSLDESVQLGGADEMVRPAAADLQQAHTVP